MARRLCGVIFVFCCITTLINAGSAWIDNTIHSDNFPNVNYDGKYESELDGKFFQKETKSHIMERFVQPQLVCNVDPSLIAEIQGYQPLVDQIIDYVTKGAHKGQTYDTLAILLDTFGPRPTGSDVLEAAIDYMITQSVAVGLENVHTESFNAPYWVRNNESAWITSPRLHRLNILGLGSSVGTPPEGITAEVLVVTSFDDLTANADKALGKIVVYNMAFEDYFTASPYRRRGASEAAKVGAVGALIRSLTDFSINSPHTGQQNYDIGVTKIPVASITMEDAALMQRIQTRGQTLQIHLTMGAVNLPDIITRNTIAEVRGLDLPNEAVVISGHLDSWDVGNGAMDDGGGVMVSWNAAVVLHRLGLKPRRTVRTIMWSAEEQGRHGGQAYFDNHISEKDLFQLILESDGGTFRPIGLAFSGTDEALCIIREIMSLMASINATEVVTPMDGPDIEVWATAGLPAGSLYNADEKYFWFHHTDGDTMSVEDPDTLDKVTAMWASVAFVAADLSQQIPRVYT